MGIEGLDNGDDELANYKYERGENWTEENIKTLNQWLHVGAININICDESIKYYRRQIRRNTIVNLIFSTIASTTSLSQFNTSIESNESLGLILKIFFSIASILIALSTGYLKVYQVQENLEQTIQYQHNLIMFSSRLSSEMQLPVKLRKDALYMIIKMKETYHELLRNQIQVNKKIIEKVAIANRISPQKLTITDLFETVIIEEWNRVKAENGDTDAIIIPFDESNGVYDMDSDTGSEKRQKITKQRSGNRLFENKSTKQLRTLNKQVADQRAQINTIVMTPSSGKPKSEVIKELRAMKNMSLEDKMAYARLTLRTVEGETILTPEDIARLNIGSNSSASSTEQQSDENNISPSSSSRTSSIELRNIESFMSPPLSPSPSPSPRGTIQKN